MGKAYILAVTKAASRDFVASHEEIFPHLVVEIRFNISFETPISFVH